MPAGGQRKRHIHCICPEDGNLLSIYTGCPSLLIRDGETQDTVIFQFHVGINSVRIKFDTYGILFQPPDIIRIMVHGLAKDLNAVEMILSGIRKRQCNTAAAISSRMVEE